MESNSNSHSTDALYVVGITGYTYLPDGTFTGVKQAGKDTLAAELKQVAEQKGFHVVIHSLARPLKKAIAKCYQAPLDELEQKKEQPHPDLNGWSFRQVLNLSGTEVGRSGPFDDKLWLVRAEEKIKYWQRPFIDRLIIDWFPAVNDEDFKDPLVPKQKWNGWSLQELRYYVDLQWSKVQLPIPQRKPILFIVPDIRFPNEAQWIHIQPKSALICKRRELEHKTNSTKAAPLAHSTDQGIPMELITHTCPSFQHDGTYTVKEQLQQWAVSFLSNLIAPPNTPIVKSP